MKKIATIAIVLLLTGMCGQLRAQETQNEQPLTIVEGSHFSIGARIGYSNLMANATKNGRLDSQVSPGGACLSFDVAYTHFVSDHVGLRLGLDISDYMSSFKVNGYEVTTSQPVQVSTGSETLTTVADFRTTVGKVSSQYNMFMIGIPAGLAFQGEKWYAVASIKVNLPVSLKENTKVSNVSTVCTSIGHNTIDEIPQAETERSEFAATAYKSSKRGNPIMPYFIGSVLEAGYRLGNEKGHGILIGVYLETSFNAVKFDNSNEFVTYTDEGTHELKPTLQSNIVKSLQLFDVGFKMQYDISVRQPRRK